MQICNSLPKRLMCSAQYNWWSGRRAVKGRRELLRGMPAGMFLPPLMGNSLKPVREDVRAAMKKKLDYPKE